MKSKNSLKKLKKNTSNVLKHMMSSGTKFIKKAGKNSKKIENMNKNIINGSSYTSSKKKKLSVKEPKVNDSFLYNYPKF